MNGRTLQVPGNEKADREAERAANGLTLDAKTLSLYLRKLLLTNPTAAKRKFINDLTNKWKIDWSQSARGKKIKKINKTTPSVKFLMAISKDKLSREAASRIVQFQLGHISLNSYLYRFKRADKANCLPCSKMEAKKHAISPKNTTIIDRPSGIETA